MKKSEAHGEPQCYTAGCRCDECRAGKRNARKRLQLRKSRGYRPYVSSDRARRHVMALRETGMPARQIASTVGWKSHRTMWQLLSKPTITADTQARILAVRPTDPCAPTDAVDATGTRRRLQSLAVLGWPARHLAARLGLHRMTITVLRNGSETRVRISTRDAVNALYNDLWDKPGPDVRSTNHANREGWVPPMMWDDDTIDDPTATPHGALINQRSRRSNESLVEDFLDTWDDHRGEINIAAARLDMSPKSLKRALARARARGVDVTWSNDEGRSVHEEAA